MLAGMGALVVLGCSNDAIPGPKPRVSEFQVDVTTGVTPEYSWSVGPAASLRVVRGDNFAEVAWIIVSKNSSGNPVNGISSPVTHGTVPTGAELDNNDEPQLEPGVAYEVTVAKADGTAGFTVFLCCN
jgi:hypothetical protein